VADTGYTAPTQAEIIDRTGSDYNSLLDAEESRIPLSPGWIFTRVLSGAVRGLHDAIAYALEQLLPTTAAEYWLAQHAKIRAIPRTAATYAAGDLDFTGTNGTNVPIGTPVQRVEDGEPGTVTTGGTVAGGTVTVTIQADNSGALANSVAGVKWQLTSPITGLDSTGEVNATSPVEGGNDQEDLEGWRERVVDAWHNPVGAGTVADYKAWAKTVEAVDEAFIEANEFGAGTVGVRVTAKPSDMTYTDGQTGPDSSTMIASPATQSEVDTAIADRKPITAAVTQSALTSTAQAFTIAMNGGGTPSNAVIGAVEAALHAMFIRLKAPSSSGYTIYRSQYVAAIAVAQGETFHNVTSPAGDIVVPADQVGTLGTLTWV